MIYVGINISKHNHIASDISADDETLIEPFKFTNDYDGFYLLLSKLDSLKQKAIQKCNTSIHFPSKSHELSINAIICGLVSYQIAFIQYQRNVYL